MVHRGKKFTEESRVLMIQQEAELSTIGGGFNGKH